MPGRILVLVLAILLTTAVRAAEPATAPPKQVLLTRALVESFIASYQPVGALGKKYDAQWGKEGFSSPKGDQLTKDLEAKGALAAFDALVRNYGFASFKEWLPVYYSTVMAYGFGDPKNDLFAVEARLQNSLAVIHQDPKLTPAQRADYEAAIRKSMASYAALKPPGENVAIVQHYRDKLRVLFGDSER